MQDKKIRKIFNSISFRYDLANFFISLGIERYWRRKFLKMISGSERKILDACCGTGYSTLGIVRKLKNHSLIYGVDFSKEMLEVARLKSEKYLSDTDRHSGTIIRFREGDITSLDFNDNFFELITIVFGIRNVKDRKKALQELHRISSGKGRLLIMEFNYPGNKFVRKLYDFYLNYIMSSLGAIITGKREAYRYLSESIRDFPDIADFSGIIEDSGWKILKVLPMTFGTCTIYFAEK